MQPALAARRPFEVFYGVGHVHRAAVEAGIDHRAVEQLPGRTDKRLALHVFLVPRLLANHDHAGIGRAFAKDGLRRVGKQRAAFAKGRGLLPG